VTQQVVNFENFVSGDHLRRESGIQNVGNLREILRKSDEILRKSGKSDIWCAKLSVVNYLYILYLA